MAAGYETTATTLAFSILLLGRHPHAQQRLLQEVDSFKVSWDALCCCKGLPWPALNSQWVQQVTSEGW